MSEQDVAPPWCPAQLAVLCFPEHHQGPADPLHSRICFQKLLTSLGEVAQFGTVALEKPDLQGLTEAQSESSDLTCTDEENDPSWQNPGVLTEERRARRVGTMVVLMGLSWSREPKFL